MRPTASVVICCYTERRLALLRQATAAVLAQLEHGDELVVVVDHNESLRSRLDLPPSARVVANAEASGLSGARNTGVAVATAEVVAFLDDDAVPTPTWLEELLAPFADTDVAGVGGRVDAAWEAARPPWFAPELDWVVGCSYRGQQHGTVRNPIGANMAFRRRVLVDAGGFRHGLGRVGTTPLGCEETELGLRVAALGLGRCVVVPGAAVRHFVPIDRATGRYLLRRCYGEGLSKAVVSRHARTAATAAGREGSGPPTLAAERRYLGALARGVAGATATAVRRREVAPLGAAAAIPAGLLATVAGYARGVLATADA